MLAAPRAPAPDAPGTTSAPRAPRRPRRPVDVTVLMPCLDEAATLPACIGKARRALADLGVPGEVLVADNGSTDGSPAIARAHGARVVHVARRGYGAALAAGIDAARGRWVIMADADDSYDLGGLAPFIRALQDGAELVMGNRFRGGIVPGAMPALHRYLGNPVLTGVGRVLFRSPCRDFHCGMRGFSRDAVRALGLRTTGMEFASEMVVKATLHGLRIAEVPTTLAPDGRGRAPHLRSWRDGWRHLRFLLLYSPRYLFLVPGLLLATLGALVMAALLAGPRRVGAVTFDVHTLLFASVALVTGAQLVLFAALAKLFAAHAGLLPHDPRLPHVGRHVTLERGLLASGAALAAGLGLALAAVRTWEAAGFGPLAIGTAMRLSVPAGTLIVLGVQGVFSSFLLSLFAIPRR
ncbi:dolichol-P-glucose synthetase [Gemmatimonadetes bacterium T265]|nr:dolichol-P-glucose synthetase [Gemmatimonadetes bacterium T265]